MAWANGCGRRLRSGCARAAEARPAAVPVHTLPHFVHDPAVEALGRIGFVVVSPVLGVSDGNDIITETGAWEALVELTSLLPLAAARNATGFIRWLAHGISSTSAPRCTYCPGPMGVISRYATGPAPIRFGSG